MVGLCSDDGMRVQFLFVVFLSAAVVDADDEAGQHVPAQREPRDARPASKRAPLALTRQLKRGAEIVVSSGAKRRRMYDQVIPEAGTTSSARIPADAVKIDQVRHHAAHACGVTPVPNLRAESRGVGRKLKTLCRCLTRVLAAPLGARTQISTIADLADSLSALALPDQLAAILGNRYLQHAVSVDPSRSGILRIAHWLAYQLEQVGGVGRFFPPPFFLFAQPACMRASEHACDWSEWWWRVWSMWALSQRTTAPV